MVTVSGKIEYFDLSRAVISVWRLNQSWYPMKGSYFQKGPPPLVLRYSNLLSEIRELFATWTPSRQIRTWAVKHFQIWSLTLDPIQSNMIWTYEPLPTYGHLLVESHHSNVRKTLLWLFATLLCWFRTTKYLLGKCYFFYSSHQAGTYNP